MQPEAPMCTGFLPVLEEQESGATGGWGWGKGHCDNSKQSKGDFRASEMLSEKSRCNSNL